MSALQVELVAADRRVWKGTAREVSARSVDGEIGILPEHAPLLVVLAPGEIRIHDEGQVRRAKVDGGFMSVEHDRVTIISEVVDDSGMGI